MSKKPTHPAKPVHNQPAPPPPPPPPPPLAPPPAAATGPVYPRCADTAWMYQPIPPGAPIIDLSDAYTAELLRQISDTTKNMGANVYSYSAPVYNPPPGTPLVKVVAADYIAGDGTNWGTLPGLQDAWAAVPLADFMKPSEGTDGEMLIFKPDTGEYWEFWAMQRAVPSALRGGGLADIRTNPGAWTGNTGYGIAATGLIYASLQITVAELLAGEIRHAVGLMPRYTAPWYGWPAQRGDGWAPDGYVPALGAMMPEGIRGFLDPAADLSALHPVAQTVGRGIKTYGFVVPDKTGSTPAIRFENPLSRTAIGLPDPYPALLNGVHPYNIFAGFPWDKLRWLPGNFGMTP